MSFLNQDGLLSADFARGKRNPAETLSGSCFPDSAYAFCAVRKEASKPFLLESYRAVEQESGIGGRMVRAGNKTTKTGKQATGGGNGEGLAPMKESIEVGVIVESTKTHARFTEMALLGERGRLQRIMDSNHSQQGEQPETNRNGFSQALAWKAEPEWQGELSETESETAAGSREPEECFD